MLKKLLYFFLFLSLILLVLGVGGALWGYHYITRDLPPLFSIEDYKPQAVSKVYAADGTVIGEFYKERRYPVKVKDVPEVVKKAFIAAEDASFYSHKGIDPVSIFRAIVKNVETGEASQGGSTITQQVVKNLLLTPEKKITRKIKEAILSYRIENALSKDEILELYLNQIFFGNTAYGIKAAAELYFRKPLSEITLPEAALLAGLPKAPSKFSPLTNMERAKIRQRYVLSQMVDAGFITKEEKEKAFSAPLKVYQASAQNFFDAPYFLAEVRRVLQEKFRDIDIDADGLSIYTPLDLQANKYVSLSVQKGLREVDKRRGYRGPLNHLQEPYAENFKKMYGTVDSTKEVYPALVVGVNKQKSILSLDINGKTALLELKKINWAKKRITKDDKTFSASLDDAFKVGDVIEVSSEEGSAQEGIQTVTLDQTPEIEGAGVILNPKNGDVIAMVGGYSYQRNQFNRVTQSLRQPGSSFKPIVYLAAVDEFNYTPTTIVYDTPRTFKVGDTVWSPGNFDEKFLGPITLRTALEKSRNLVSVDIVSRIGLTPIIKYASLLGIESPLGRNLSIALGSSEVTLLELARAYGVFPAEGVLFKTNFISKITDRNGIEIYSADKERYETARQVISPESAFIMANMMKGVIQSGTATSIKSFGRPAAGKTGTTNDFMDTWFIGYTPEYVAGVWVGFDQKKAIGPKETGGRISAPIWANFMKPFLEGKDKENQEKLIKESMEESKRLGVEYIPPEKDAVSTPPDFRAPEGVTPFWINKQSGFEVSKDSEGAFLEYFRNGTSPRAFVPEDQQTTQSYLEDEGL